MRPLKNRILAVLLASAIQVALYYLIYNAGWIVLSNFYALEYRLSWNILVTFTLIVTAIISLLQLSLLEFTRSKIGLLLIVGLLLFVMSVFRNLTLSPYRTLYLLVCFTTSYLFAARILSKLRGSTQLSVSLSQSICSLRMPNPAPLPAPDSTSASSRTHPVL